MSSWKTQFDPERGRDTGHFASQARSTANSKSSIETIEVEPTEVVSLSQKPSHGKATEKGQLQPSPQRHVASSQGDSPHHLTGHLSFLSHIPAASHGKARRDEGSEHAAALENSISGAAGSEGAKFLRRIPRIPSCHSSNEQCARDQPVGHAPFQPSQPSNFGTANLVHAEALTSDVIRRPSPRDEPDGSLNFHKQTASKQATGSRVRNPAEAEMQRNVSAERPHGSLYEDDLDSRGRSKDWHGAPSNVVYLSRADLSDPGGRKIAHGPSQERQNTRPRHTAGGGKARVYYESTQQRHSSRGVVYHNTRAAGRGARHYNSGTDSHITSSGTESDISSSPDFQAILRRKKRVRRKASPKHIDSHRHGGDNSSDEFEPQNTNEVFSDTYTGHSGARESYMSQETAPRRPTAPIVSLSKLKSSSLSSVSTLEGRGLSNFRANSPTIARVSKTQISSFTGFSASRSNSSGQQKCRRSSLDEGRFAAQGVRGDKAAESPSPSQQLSKSPFSLRAKPFGFRGRLSRGHSLGSDSDSSVTATSRHSMLPITNAAVSTASPNHGYRDEKSMAPNHDNGDQKNEEDPCFQEGSRFASQNSAFESVNQSRRSKISQTREEFVDLVGDDEEKPPGYPVMASNDQGSLPDTLNDRLSPEIEQKAPANDGSHSSVQPTIPDLDISVHEGPRPLSIVCEQDEYPDLGMRLERPEMHMSKVKKTSLANRKSSQQAPSERERKIAMSPPLDGDTAVSAVRRPSYMKAQWNSEMQSFAEPYLSQPSKYSESSTSTTHHALRTVPDLDSSDDLYDYEVLQSMHSGSESWKKGVAAPPPTEGDLISFFEDEKDESPPEPAEELPVEKRRKRSSRPKIPPILSCGDVEKLKMQYDDGEGGVLDSSESSKDATSTAAFDGVSKHARRSPLEDCPVHGSDEENTQRADCDVEKCVLDELKHAEDEDDSVFEPEKMPRENERPRPLLHGAVPQIKAELYTEQQPQIAKVIAFSEKFGQEKMKHSGFSEYLYKGDEDPALSSNLLANSPSPSQHNFDANSLTTSGFSETHSEQISTTDLQDESHYGGLGPQIPSNNNWRSQSDPTGRANGNGAPLSETIAEAERVSAQRNSNSEPNLSNEKLKKEKEELAKRLNGGVNAGRTQSSPESLSKFDHHKNQDNRRILDQERVIAEGSPDECYELDKPESPVRPQLKRTISPPSPLTAVRTKYANSFSNEMKLNKLGAMEPILELPNSEASAPVIDMPRVKAPERKSGVSYPSPEMRVEKSQQPTKEEKRRLSATVQPEGKSAKKKHDMRKHVFQNLLETEESYVQNLQYLVSNYYKPLKKPDNTANVEPAQVDDMFYQIPEILNCHESFLERLQDKMMTWHDKQKIGDIFVSDFTKCFLMDAYSGFINNFFVARTAVRVATMSKPGFVRFIERCVRDHKEKLTLQDLMIMPVQRIPRYELLLKDMIKHTPADHPDHSSLQMALVEIKALAERMNRGEKEVDQAEREAENLRELEASIEGMADLAVPSRKLLRQDLVAEVKGTIIKKDRCLFFFNDMLACGSVKRKAAARRRGSLSFFSGQSGAEVKYKLLWKLPLDCIDIIKESPGPQRRNSLEKLDKDMSQLSEISALADSLGVSHQLLDTAIRELMNEVSRQINERQVPATAASFKLDLQAQTDEGLENYTFQFLGDTIRDSWETYFENAKQKLAYAKDAFPPEFQCPVQIRKHRSGMQFTCASPSLVPHLLDRGNHCGSGDVWVCNSDGYVGEVSILRMSDLQTTKTLDVCKARILCISPVPGSTLIELDEGDTDDARSDGVSLFSETSMRERKVSAYSRDDSVHDIMPFDSSSEDEDGHLGNSYVSNKFNDTCSSGFNGRLSPEGSSLGTTGSVDGDESDSGRENNISDSDDHGSSEDERKAKGSRKRGAKPEAVSMDSLRTEDGQSLADYNLYGNPAEEDSTVWLGAKDGSIYVYSVNKGQTKRCKRMSESGDVQSILYVDNQVFVALSSGILCVYRRQPGCPWEVGSPVKVDIGSSTATPISCMTAVHGRLWCGCGSDAVIVNTTKLEIEKSFNCCLEEDSKVYRMASSGMGVWLSLQRSAVVRLFHATRYESLADVDMGPPVEKMLAGSDAIIRQHKAACLRVTALLGCKDLLWIGTSAGVVLTLPLPTITASTSSLQNCPAATASFHGHTGHVRFLTAVEVPKEAGNDSPVEKESSPLNAPASTREILIISGGDGYEDFKMNSSNESAGRDDSTNHLLIWRV